MVDLDEGIQEWRYRHVKMVERTIGMKVGTGGSAGAEYLRRTLFQPLFPGPLDHPRRAVASRDDPFRADGDAELVAITQNGPRPLRRRAAGAVARAAASASIPAARSCCSRSASTTTAGAKPTRRHASIPRAAGRSNSSRCSRGDRMEIWRRGVARHRSALPRAADPRPRAPPPRRTARAGGVADFFAGLDTLREELLPASGADQAAGDRRTGGWSWPTRCPWRPAAAAGPSVCHESSAARSGQRTGDRALSPGWRDRLAVPCRRVRTGRIAATWTLP